MEQLTKKELITLCKKFKIKTTTKMLKQELIDLLSAHDTINTKISKISPKLSNKKTKSPITLKKENDTTPKKLKKKTSSPIKTLAIQYDTHITILPQSSQKALVVWNADPQLEEEIKAWQIINQYGLDVLLPHYARSFFINITPNESLEFSLYAIFQQDNKILFESYFQEKQNVYNDLHIVNTTNEKIVQQHLQEYSLNSSSSHFF